MKTIPQFPEHSISEDGKTITNMHGRIIKQGNQILNGKETGYIYATMLAHDYSYFNRVGVHRLVAFTYLPKPETNKHVWVNHKDGDKSNNHYSNLEWSTISQNIQHAHDNGLIKQRRGSEHHMYGRKVSASTRLKQSITKLGENHPKFKGYYVIDGRKYASANQASKALGIPGKTIIQRCQHPMNKDYFFLPAQPQQTRNELTELPCITK